MYATTDINATVALGDAVTIVDATHASWENEVYFISKEEENYLEFTLQEIAKKIYVLGTKALTPEQIKQIERLTEMDAATIVEQLLEQASKSLATISGPAVLTNATPTPYTITWDDPDGYGSRVAIFDYKIQITTSEGNPAPVYIHSAVTDDTKDDMKLTITGFTGGSYIVKIIFEWKDPDDGSTKRIATKSKLTDWDKAIVIVDSGLDYETLKAAGMLLSPASVDATNFGNAKDLTKSQMVNPEVLERLHAQYTNIPASSGALYDKKFNYLKDYMSVAEADALAKRFVLLDEVTPITALSTAQFSWSNIRHFEAFGYFIGMKELVPNQFASNSELETIFLPTSLTTIGANAFYDNPNLTNIQTLED